MYSIINLDDINLSAPYFVYASSDNKSIKFTTDNTLHYTVSFIEDYNFPGAYQFFLYEDDKRKSSYDEKISLTILSILRSFFTDKNKVLLFICDAQDDRQCGRNLLFSKWYHIYGSKAYHKEDLVINVGGTCSYYASFICRKDHPSLKIMQETFIDFQKKNSK